MTEAELIKKILDIARNSKADYSPLPVPSCSATDGIADDSASEISDYFINEVIPFTATLESAAKKLSNTLDFNMHDIFNKIASGSVSIVNSGEIISKNVSKSVNETIKKLFRYILWPWIKTSYFVNRGMLKPHGFPGDYVIVEAMYDGNPKSLGLGYIYDLIFLQTQLCRGLRNRKDQMKQILHNYLSQHGGKDLSILNVGCGGSRELLELPLPNDGEGLNIHLIDFDSRATVFSLSSLTAKGIKARLSPLNIDVREIVKNGLSQLRPSSVDFIYSIGLFDYLPDRILVKLLQSLKSLLKENGVLVFAHKDFTIYDPKIADWFCDWKYYPRTQSDIEQILISLGIDSREVKYSREKDGYIFFAEIFNMSSTKNNPANP